MNNLDFNDIVSCIASCICLYHLLFVRIAKANWKNVQARYLAVYVGYVLVHFGVIYFVFTRGVSNFAVILGLTQMLWLWNTREDWKTGIPEHMKTDSAPLGPPEEPTT